MDELELNISAEELEEVIKYDLAEYGFPVIRLRGRSVGFNIAAFPLLDGVRAVRWFTTPEYVIGIPADPEGKNAYMVQKTYNKENDKNAYVAAAFPAPLKHEKKIQEGYYRLYKYKNGFAFKRYERIAEN